MKITFIRILAALQITAAGGAFHSALAVEKEYYTNIGQFDKLTVNDNVNVIYRCNPDSTGHIYYKGDPEFGNAFIFENKNGNLKIQVLTEDVGKPGLPTLYVYSDFLYSVESSSLFNVKVIDPAPCSNFKATLIGNGNMSVTGLRTTKLKGSLSTGMGNLTISGKCTEAKYRMVGTGNINAGKMEAETVHCSILGSGIISCYPLQFLKVSGLGSTHIYYHGNPIVKKSGGGKLKHIPSPSPSLYGNDEEFDLNPALGSESEPEETY